MNVTRSPSSNAGGSQPDLFRISGDSDSQITFRKRKQPDKECACSEELKLMRNDLSRITALLENYIGSNSQMISQMSDSIKDLKTEISNLRASHEQSNSLLASSVADIRAQVQVLQSETLLITSEQASIKTQLSHLETKRSNDENKLKLLETNFNELNISPQVIPNQLSMNEQIIREIQSRKKRENNIIIVGIPEQISSNIQERVLKDESDVLKITSIISGALPKPIKTYRIGKYSPNKARRIKVCFDTPGPAQLLLRSKAQLPEDIKLYSDQTPAQQKYFQSVKGELSRRIKNGESDITIKYIDGIPSIIKSQTKNSKQKQ